MNWKTIKLILMTLLIFLITQNVSALELTMENKDNPYYLRSGEGFNDSNRLTFYNLDGETVYCVEPGVQITNSFYQEISFDSLSYSKEKLDLVMKIGYYGYEYPGRNTVKYRMATQALIWENLRDISVSFWSQKNGEGEAINIDEEKRIIMNDVNNHQLLPDISSDITISINNEEMIEDKNKVLNDFEIIDSSDLNIEIIDNSLHVKTSIEGDYEISLKKKKYDNKVSILYGGIDGTSQKLAKLRINDDIIFKIKIHVVSGKLQLQKLNDDTKTKETIGTASLENALYGLYKEDHLIQTFTTGKDGFVEIKNIPLDNYYVKEIKPSYGYELDNNIYEVNFSKDKLEVFLEVLEKPIKKEFILIKTLETESSILENEKDITFQIYEKNNNILYQEVTTDKNGLIKINLPYGNYIIKQQNTTKGYLSSENIEVLIDENTDSILKVIEDKMLRFQLKLIKVDMETGDTIPISGFEFKIKDLNSSEFIEHNNTSIFTTDFNGEFITSLPLGAGEYEVYELSSPVDIYEIRQDPMKISVYDENNLEDNIYTLKFPNSKKEIVVPNTSLNENISIKIFSGLLFLFGMISLFLFYRIKNKNLS